MTGFPANKIYPNSLRSIILKFSTESSHQYHIDLKLNNRVLDSQHATKILGVFIGYNLNMHSHIDYLPL